MAIILNAENAQLLYVAYYGRPGDPAGVRFWTEQLAAANFSFDPANGDFISPEEQPAFDKLINDFGTSPEATALFDNLSNAEAINIVYQQLFNREPDAAGFAFWLNQLNTGAVTLPEFAFAVAFGATGSDVAVLEGKVASAKLFTSAIDTRPEGLSYDGANFAGAVQAGRDFLAQYGPDVATPAEVDQALADLVAEATPAFQVSVSPDSSVEGSSFSVTVITNNIPNGTVIGFTVGGSDALITTSGQITIVNGIGVATILTKADADSVDDIATIQLTSLPTTPFGPIPAPSAQFTIAEPPPNSSFILTSNQDIVDGTAVPVFTFFGNEQTVGQGDILGRGDAELAILDITTDGSFSIAGFELDGVQDIELFANNGDQGDTGFLNLSRAFGLERIFVDQSDLGVITFRDIQTGDGLFIDVLDSASIFEVNIDASELLGDETVTLEIAESPIDDDTFRAASFDFTQGPSFAAAQIETLNLISTEFGGFDGNVIGFLQVSNALTTLNITGNASLEILQDIGVPSRNGQINLIDASTLDGDLTFDYTSDVRGRVEVLGAIGDNTLGLFSNSRPASVGATSFDVILQDGDDSVVTDLGSDLIVAAEGDNTIVSTTVDILPEDLFDNIVFDDHNPPIIPLVGGLPVGNSTVTQDIDIVTAGDGNNSIVTGAGGDIVEVGDGDNFIDASGFVTSTVNRDRDIVITGDGNNTVFTGESDDIVTTGAGDDFIDAGVLYARVRIGGVPNATDSDDDIVNAGEGNNVVLTGFGDDSVVSGSGNDSINVGTGEFAGDNIVVAGDGSNTVVAGFGDDSIITGDGTDTIVASNGNNTVRSNDGNDVIVTGDGRDGIFAGGGDDTVSLKGRNLTGADRIDGGEGTADFISFTAGDRIETTETSGVTNIEGFELLNLGAVLGKRLGLLNGEGFIGNSLVNGDPTDIVAELEILLGLLQPGETVGDFLEGFGVNVGLLIDEIEDLQDDINAFVSLFIGGNLSDFTEEDLATIDEFLARVDAIQATVSPALPIGGPDLRTVFSNLDDLDIELNNQELNKLFIDRTTEKFLLDPGSFEYVITLSPALVSSSDDIREEFLPFQDVKFFTVDAELALSSVTLDLTELPDREAGGDGLRLGVEFLGQSALIQGGFEERIVVGDRFLSETLVANYGDQIADDRDVLEIVNEESSGVTVTADDLSSIFGLDRIVLSSASSSFNQEFDIDITPNFLAGQGGNLDGQFVITADPSLQPNTVLNLRVAPDFAPGVPRILVLKSANLQVNLINSLTGEPILLIGTPTEQAEIAAEFGVEIRDALFFTQNADDLEGTTGDDLFIANQVTDLNSADFAQGLSGSDTLELEFGVFNTEVDPESAIAYELFDPYYPIGVDVDLFGLTLSEQFNLADIEGIETFVFDPKNNDGVRFDGFNIDENQFGEIDLFSLNQLLTTPGEGLSQGADLLFLDDFAGDAGAEFGNASLAVFTFDGNDTVITEEDFDEFDGEEFNNRGFFINVGNGDDLVIAIRDGEDQQGEDTGGDTIVGGAGNDTIITSAVDADIEDDEPVIDDDSELEGTGNNSIDAGTGDDLVFGSAFGDNTVIAGEGYDTVVTGIGDDSILGGSGSDIIFADGPFNLNTFSGPLIDPDSGFFNNPVLGNSSTSAFGQDTVSDSEGDSFIITGGNSDSVITSDTNDIILAGIAGIAGFDDGDLILTPVIDADTVDAGDGANLIVTLSDDDSIISGSGSDLILAGFAGGDSNGTDNDTVFAGGGNDLIEIASGDDFIQAGAGNDFIVSLLGSDSVSPTELSLDSGDWNGISTGDTILGGSGFDVFLTAFGDSSDDIIIDPRLVTSFVNGEDPNGVPNQVTPPNAPLFPPSYEADAEVVNPVFDSIETFIFFSDDADIYLTDNVAVQAGGTVSVFLNDLEYDGIGSGVDIVLDASDFEANSSLRAFAFNIGASSIEAGILGEAGLRGGSGDDTLGAGSALQAGILAGGTDVASLLSSLTEIVNNQALEKALDDPDLFADLIADIEVGGINFTNVIQTLLDPNFPDPGDDQVAQIQAILDVLAGTFNGDFVEDFISYQGNGGADVILLEPTIFNVNGQQVIPENTPEFVRYVTTNDGAGAGSNTGFDTIFRFNNANSSLTGPGGTLTGTPVPPPAGLTTITSVVGDKIVIGGESNQLFGLIDKNG
ncbi:DUF4214 domain-containing protein [Synechococcus elongatus]|uniref:DUF4214 domain-containing protein n=1 Tax=Synechococcus elongatus TaxID=32046 RepID=UPI000F7ECCCE|nr:DUF4214 domain-containing protein [Synechococcus elongatus]